MRYKPILEKDEKIGWISGLIWTSDSAFSSSNSQHIWYGQSQDQQNVFRIVHEHIKNSLSFHEHGLVQFLKHIFTCVAFIGACFIAIKAILHLKEQKYQILGKIGSALFSALSVWGQIKGIVAQVYKYALIRKLKLLVKECNEDLQLYGYKIKFPRSKAYFLFCIPFKICDVDDTTVLEIFSLQQEGNLEEKNVKNVLHNEDETTNYETMA